MGSALCGDGAGLTDAITMVDVDVEVQYARMVLEKLKNAEDDVVDVAEARRLGLLGVVHPARPVDRDVRLLCHQLLRRLQAVETNKTNNKFKQILPGAGVARAEVVETVEHGAVRGAHVVVGQRLAELLDVVGGDPLQGRVSNNQPTSASAQESA